MYRETIQNLIAGSLLEIDADVKVEGRRPTMANSQFLIHKEQGDWAEQIVHKAINENSDEYFAVKYGRSGAMAAGEEGFDRFYDRYQDELNTIGKKPDLLIFRSSDFPGGEVEIENNEHIESAVAALEIRSSSFLIERYIDFMTKMQGNALTKCMNIRNTIMSGDLAKLLEQKKQSDLQSGCASHARYIL